MSIRIRFWVEACLCVKVGVEVKESERRQDAEEGTTVPLEIKSSSHALVRSCVQSVGRAEQYEGVQKLGEWSRVEIYMGGEFVSGVCWDSVGEAKWL